MHTKNYKEAEALLNMAIGSDRFNSLAISMQEKWKLFEAYLLFIYSETNVQHVFRIMKFVNEVETLAKDKGGMNPAILIAQLLHIMKKGNWDDAMTRSESLRVYASRNLKPSVAYRTIIFIKLLASFVKYRFDKSQLIKRTETKLNKLKGSKISGQENMDALEIIPYEILWESVMQFVTGKRSS